MDAMQFVASFSGCIRDFGQTEQVVEILVDDIKGMTAEMPEFTTRRGDLDGREREVEDKIETDSSAIYSDLRIVFQKWNNKAVKCTRVKASR